MAYVSKPNPNQPIFATREEAEKVARAENAARVYCTFEIGVTAVEGGWQLCSYSCDG